MALALAPALVGAVSATASALESRQPFFGTAAADGVRVHVMLRGFLVVEELADIGGPTAQAEMSDVEASSYAGYPWPGDGVLAAMVIGAGRSGLPLGDYPLVARSSTTGERESTAGRGPVIVSAKSSDSQSAATAKGGLVADAFAAGETAARAVVSHDPTTGTAEVEATNVAEGIRVGDVVSFGAIRSRAHVVSVPGGTAKPSSQLQVSDAVIAGHEVLIGPDGLRFADTGLPVPRESSLIRALAEAGISLEYIEATESDDGVIAAGLRISVVQKVPEVPEPVEVVIELGRARAFAQGGSRSTSQPLDDLAGSDLDPGGDFGTGSAPDVSLTTGTSRDTLGTGAAPPTHAASAVIPSPHEPASTVLRGRPALTVDAPLFYPTLAAAGVLLVCCTTSLRLFAVRLLWRF